MLHGKHNVFAAIVIHVQNYATTQTLETFDFVSRIIKLRLRKPKAYSRFHIPSLSLWHNAVALAGGTVAQATTHPFLAEPAARLTLDTAVPRQPKVHHCPCEVFDDGGGIAYVAIALGPSTHYVCTPKTLPLVLVHIPSMKGGTQGACILRPVRIGQTPTPRAHLVLLRPLWWLTLRAAIAGTATRSILATLPTTRPGTSTAARTTPACSAATSVHAALLYNHPQHVRMNLIMVRIPSVP